jgi:hypothetical protein
VVSSPRRYFIEDNRPNTFFVGGQKLQISNSFISDGTLKEKTAIQGLIDRHWYGEPLEYVQSATGEVMARIPDPLLNPKDDSKIYASSVPRTIDGINKYPPGDRGSELQRISQQPFFALRFNRYFDGIGNGTISIFGRPQGSPTSGIKEVWTIEIGADGSSFNVRSNLRGTFPTGTVGVEYNIRPEGYSTEVSFFMISTSGRAFEAGDSFILDVDYTGLPVQRTGDGFNSSGVINLLGWWEIIESDTLETYYSGGYIGDGDEHLFNVEDNIITTVQNPDGGNITSVSISPNRKHSWLIFIRKIFQVNSDTVIAYEINSRNLGAIQRQQNIRPGTDEWFRLWFKGAR